MNKKTITLLLFIIGLVFLFTPCRILALQTSSIPENLSLSPSSNGFLIAWNPVSSDAVVYKIYWGYDDSVSDVNYEGVLTTNDTVYEHAGLTPGRSYFYRIAACSCECGQLSNLISAVFEPSPAAVYTLSGTVTVNGVAIQPGTTDPMVAATVRAVEVTGANQGNSVNVNPDGTYQMALFPGTYDVSVDYRLVESWHGTQINFSFWGRPGPQGLSIQADAAQDIDIPLHVLTGAVQDSDGEPVADVALSYSNGAAATSAEDGYRGVYKLYFMPGTYSLEAEPPDGSRLGPAVVEVSLPGPAPTIELETLPLLSGTVAVNGVAIQPGTTDPMVEATVRAVEVTGANQGNSASVNPDGTYRMALFPGTYNISVDLRLGESWHGTWVSFSSWDQPGPQNLSIEADTAQDIDMPLCALTGVVQDSGGAPVADVALSYRDGAAATSAEAGSLGAYKLYFMPGTYSLKAEPPAGSRLGPAVVEVSVPGPAPSIELQTLPLLSGTVAVNGVAIQPGTADPMVAATVRAVEVTGANQGNSASVNPDGTYRMALFPGTYNISVDFWFGESWHGTWTRFGSWGRPGPQNLPIDGNAIQDIDMPLYVLTGVVQDSGGAPVADVALSYRDGAAATSAEAGSVGAYKLYFMPGAYSLQVTAPPALFPPFQVDGIEIMEDSERDIVLGEIDSAAPGTPPNQPPSAVANGPYFGTAGVPVLFDAGNSYDEDGAIVSYEWDWDDDGVFDESTTHPDITHTWHESYEGRVRLLVTDNEGLVEIDCASIEVVGAAAPPISLSVSKDTLWPPNHKMVPVAVDVSASEFYEPETTCYIASVTSNEPEDGSGDGRRTPDWELTGDLTVDLRAERSGAGEGRIYSIMVECVDASGNLATATTQVTVPHDLGKKKGKKPNTITNAK